MVMMTEIQEENIVFISTQSLETPTLGKHPYKVPVANVLINQQKAAAESNRDCHIAKKLFLAKPLVSFGNPKVSFGNVSLYSKQTNVDQSNVFTLSTQTTPNSTSTGQK